MISSLGNMQSLIKQCKPAATSTPAMTHRYNFQNYFGAGGSTYTSGTVYFRDEVNPSNYDAVYTGVGTDVAQPAGRFGLFLASAKTLTFPGSQIGANGGYTMVFRYLLPATSANTTYSVFNPFYCGTGANNYYYVSINPAQRNGPYTYSNAVTPTPYLKTPTANVWAYCAIVISANTVKLYTDYDLGSNSCNSTNLSLTNCQYTANVNTTTSPISSTSFVGSNSTGNVLSNLVMSGGGYIYINQLRTYNYAMTVAQLQTDYATY